MTEFDFFVLVTDNVPSADRGLVRLEYRCQCWHEAFPKFLQDSTSCKPHVQCGDLIVAHEETDRCNPKENKRIRLWGNCSEFTTG